VSLPALPAPLRILLDADPLVALAYLLLVGGVAASVLPLPSGALSLGGLYLHWWQVGRPGPVVLAGLTGLALVALAADWLGGPLAARASGVPARRAAVAGVVGLVGALMAGPPGLFVGLAGTVFVLEYRDHRDSRAGLRAAAVATVGVLAAAAVQIVATTLVLVGVLFA
jgi:hypothetical protein